MKASEETIELEHVRWPSWRRMKQWNAEDWAEFLVWGWIWRVVAAILIASIWVGGFLVMGVLGFFWDVRKGRRSLASVVGICLAIAAALAVVLHYIQ